MNDNVGFDLPELGSYNNQTNNDIGFGVNDLITVSDDKNTSMNDAYFCQSCSTTFSNSSIVDSCPFCGNATLVKTDNFEYFDLYTIPFLKSDMDAIGSLKKQVKTNPFLPLHLKKTDTLNKIKKVYLPCKICSLNVNGNVQFTCCDEMDKNTKVPVQAYDVLYSSNFDYNNLLISNYSNISSDVLNMINDYNLDNLNVFGSSSSGVYYIKDNSDSKSVKDSVIKNSIGIIRKNINHKYKKLKNNGMNITESAAKSVLVPIYMLNVEYKGKKYLYLMNGQTGKVYYDFSVDIGKVVIIFIIIFIVILLIVSLISYVI